MQNQSLLEISVDKLFETHTISEVQEVRKKLQNEVEKKKEDLRIIVGERYRDLIDAADTITEMKHTVSGVALHQNQMTVQLQQLQQRQLFGFRSRGKNTTVPERLVKNKFFSGVAMQVKILVDIPEYIWTAMEQHNYILGAQLFLLARHISTGLQLESSAPEVLPVIERMPLISQQWDTIGQFRSVILQGCQQNLQSLSLSPEEAANYLSAVVLLEGLGPLELLDRFLDLRRTSLEKVLQFDRQASVKASVSAALKLLVHTILLLYACFCDGSDDAQGLVWKKLKSIVGRDAPPSISLLGLKDKAMARFLPAVVTDYRPSCGATVQPVAPGDMRDRVTGWLDWVGGQVEQQVAALLGLVGTLRGLRGIREAAAATSTGAGWEEACRQLMVPRGLDPWREYFAPLVTVRAKTLVAHKWAEAVAELEDMLVSAVQDVTHEKCSQPEHDLRWFMWKEWTTDLPREQSNNRGLLMKVVGCTPSVEKLCLALDARLESLIQDLQFYLSPGPEEEVTNFSDASELGQHLQHCSHTNIRRLVEFVESRFVSSTEEASTVLVARFLQALTSLCPGLHKCLASNSSHREVTSSWQELCGWLRQHSLECWQAWSRLVQAQLCDVARAHLGSSLGSLLVSSPLWQEAMVQEELEEGHSISSRIRVPAQASLPLQAALWEAARRLSMTGPHAVPRSVLQGAVAELLGCLLGQYQACLDEGHVHSQAQALQLLLDVRFLTTLLLSRDNKELTVRSQEISERLEEKIDPFDLNVFSPYLQVNIKANVQRCQTLLGVLVVWPEKMLPIPGTNHEVGSKGADPSVVPLCSGAPWFPLLPLAGPPTAHFPAVTPEKPQPKKAITSKSKVEASPGDIMRSSAAAFFGAMSSEWFGSS